MFKKARTLYFRTIHKEAIKAILEILELGAKPVYATRGDFSRVKFKANRKELDKVYRMLDKYNIQEAHF